MTLLDTHELTQAGTQLAEHRRISGGPKLRRDLAEDFTDDSPQLLAGGRRSAGVRITLPSGFPASKLGRAFAGAMMAVLLTMSVAGVWEMRHLLLRNPSLRLTSLSSIEIEGNQHLTRAQLLNVFSEDLERNTLTIPVTERQNQIEQLPWVKHATVMRILPSRFRILITERTPVAFYRQGSHVGLVDATGVLLEAGPTGQDSAEASHAVQTYSFPVISGISAADPISVRAARITLFERFMAELQKSPDGIADRLSEVDLSSAEDIKSLVPTGTKDILVHFGDDHFLERYQRFEENLPKWTTDYPKLASADMRYPRQVVLEMKAGSAVPLTGERRDPESGRPPTSKLANRSLSPTKHPSATSKAGKPISSTQPSANPHPHLQTSFAAGSSVRTSSQRNNPTQVDPQ